MVIINYVFLLDCNEDLFLIVIEEVCFFCEDGVWLFVCIVDVIKRSGWVLILLLKSKEVFYYNMIRRFKFVGDIYNVYEEEEVVVCGVFLF